MSRDDNSQIVQDSVVGTAQKLFLKDGYDKTTIRKISSAASVSSGSIYHFFNGKEGILQRIIHEFMGKTFEAADDTAQASPHQRLALELCGQLKPIAAHKPIAELYLAAYKSWMVSDFIIRTGVKRNRELFESQLPDWSEAEYYRATMVIKGVLSVIVEERVHRNELSQADRARMLIQAALPPFGASLEEVKQCSEDTVEKLGFT